jgi:hypothetical protein
MHYFVTLAKKNDLNLELIIECLATHEAIHGSYSLNLLNMLASKSKTIS